jgi:hypothetical protein
MISQSTTKAISNYFLGLEIGQKMASVMKRHEQSFMIDDGPDGSHLWTLNFRVLVKLRQPRYAVVRSTNDKGVDKTVPVENYNIDMVVAGRIFI